MRDLDGLDVAMIALVIIAFGMIGLILRFVLDARDIDLDRYRDEN